MLLTQLILFIFGLFILLISANLFVNYAVKLAQTVRISPLIIGVTIVGIGTSLPEIAVSATAAWEKSSGLVAGNLIGSNIANIGLTLGLSFLFGNIRIGSTKTQINGFLLSFITCLFLIILTYGYLMSFWGVAFLFGAAAVVFWEVWAGKKGREREDVLLLDGLPKREAKPYQTTLVLVLGLTGTIFGGRILVYSALSIAEILKVAPSLIGLTMVAVGTSIPELVTDLVAIKKRQGKLILGETLGTNIYNFLLAGGLAALFTPLYFTNVVGIMACLVFTFVLLIIIRLHAGKYVNRQWGVALLLGYFIYLWFLFK
jgi:cation:H+ antiporter